MKRIRASALISVLMGIVLPATPCAAGEATLAKSTPVYQPPDRGAPPARVSGGTRTVGGPQVALRVLAPKHPGLTIREQPTLYWYASQRVDKPVIVTVVDDEAIDPVMELRLDPPISPGIWPISLAEQNVRLQPQKTYHWGVALVADARDRFKDIYAGGAITRIVPSGSLQAKLADSDESNRASVLAEFGIWYDAIDSISSTINDSSQAKRLWDHRRSLLEQVGLPEVAAFDVQ